VTVENLTFCNLGFEKNVAPLCRTVGYHVSKYIPTYIEQSKRLRKYPGFRRIRIVPMSCPNMVGQH
jgi:hypothetical protein